MLNNNREVLYWMQLEGYHSGLKDKKSSDSFVLVVQFITPLYGASRQFVFISASHFGKRCLFPSLPPLPSLPYPTLPLRACLQAGIQATDMFLLSLLLVPWLSADRLSTW